MAKIENNAQTKASELTQLLERKYQNVVLTLDDGSVAIFSGKAICFPGETRRIKNIEFTEPKDLPENYSFE